MKAALMKTTPRIKKYIMSLCTGACVLGLCTAVSFTLPEMSAVDYESVFAMAEAANNARHSIEGPESCGGVIENADNDFLTTQVYESFLAQCAGDTGNFENAVDALDESFGVQSDLSVRTEWERFKAAYDGAFPAYEEILHIYAAWHNFIANWAEATLEDDWWENFRENDVRVLTAPLFQTGNKTLYAFGEGYVTARWRHISAFQAHQKAYAAYYGASDGAPSKAALLADLTRKTEALDSAEGAYQEYKASAPNLEDTETLTGVDLSGNEHHFFTMFDSFYSIVSAKRLKRQGIDGIFNT
jgi:hypothetical protein